MRIPAAASFSLKMETQTRWSPHPGGEPGRAEDPAKIPPSASSFHLSSFAN